MSNVRIEATGELGLSVAVNLGPNERAVHACAAGEVVELTVGGNQTLNISAVEDGPTAEAEPLAVGADIVEGDDLTDPAEGGENPETTEDGSSDQNPISVNELVSDTPLEDENPLKNPFATD